MGVASNRPDVTAETISVLLVTDDAESVAHLRSILESGSSPSLQTIVARSLGAAMGELRRRRFELVLLDLALRDSQGLETLGQVRSVAPSTAIIVLTGKEEEEVGVHAVREGAQDFVVKGELGGNSFRRAMRCALERQRNSALTRDNAKALPPDPESSSSGLVQTLRDALGDLKRSHDELKAAQQRIVEAEKLEAVSTFAAGVAHEVKNPLQTIILGVDYLANHLAPASRRREAPGARSAGDANAVIDETTTLVLEDMREAVLRADAIIRGLLEFSAYSKRHVKEENLSAIIQESLQAVGGELRNYPVRLQLELEPNLPALRLDARTIRHVFINLFIYCIRAMRAGGTLSVRTSAREVTESLPFNGGESVAPPGSTRPSGRHGSQFKPGETVVIAEITDTADHDKEPKTETISLASRAGRKDLSGLGLVVLKKIIELYGGVLQTTHRRDSNQFTIAFRAMKV